MLQRLLQDDKLSEFGTYEKCWTGRPEGEVLYLEEVIVEGKHYRFHYTSLKM